MATTNGLCSLLILMSCVVCMTRASAGTTEQPIQADHTTYTYASTETSYQAIATKMRNSTSADGTNEVHTTGNPGTDGRDSLATDAVTTDTMRNPPFTPTASPTIPDMEDISSNLSSTHTEVVLQTMTTTGTQSSSISVSLESTVTISIPSITPPVTSSITPSLTSSSLTLVVTPTVSMSPEVVTEGPNPTSIYVTASLVGATIGFLVIVLSFLIIGIILLLRKNKEGKAQTKRNKVDLNEAAHHSNAMDNPMYDSYNSIKRSIEANSEGTDMEHELINPLYVDKEDGMSPPLETIHEDVEREVINPLYSDSKDLQMPKENFTSHDSITILPDTASNRGHDDRENKEVGYNKQFSDPGVTRREDTSKPVPVLYKRRSNSQHLPRRWEDENHDQEEWRRKPMLFPRNFSSKQQECEEENLFDDDIYSDVREVKKRERRTPVLPPRTPNSQHSQSTAAHESLATSTMEKEAKKPVLPPRTPNRQPPQSMAAHDHFGTSTMEKETKKPIIPSSLDQQWPEQPNLNKDGNYSKLQHFQPAIQKVIQSVSHERNELTVEEGEGVKSKTMLPVTNPDTQQPVMDNDGYNDNKVYNTLCCESPTMSLQADTGNQPLTSTIPNSQSQQNQTNRRVVLQSIKEEGKKPMLPPKVSKKEEEKKPFVPKQTKIGASGSSQSTVDTTKPQDNSPSCEEGNYSTLQHFHPAIQGAKFSVMDCDSGEYSQIHCDQ